MEADSFNTLPFPFRESVVYVVGLEDAEGFTPIYVGETNRFTGRIDDYVTASFEAATDFKVGKAIEHLREKGETIVIKDRQTTNRKGEEQSLLKKLRRRGIPLLNDLRGYDYKKANRREELQRVKFFVETILDSRTHRDKGKAETPEPKQVV